MSTDKKQKRALAHNDTYQRRFWAGPQTDRLFRSWRRGFKSHRENTETHIVSVSGIEVWLLNWTLWIAFL